MVDDENVPSGVDVAKLLRAQLRKQMACKTALARVGMTLPQWGMLHTAAGAVIARLEQRGLLERRHGFGKAILHRLTPAGATSRDAARPSSRT